MTEQPERIWLQHPDDADPEYGQMWCRDKVWPNDVDEGEPTPYVRADIYDALVKERDEWKARAQQFQGERADLADKLHGTPCAEIRWQHERDALAADKAELLAALERLAGAKAIKGVRELVAGWNGENLPEGPYTERHPSRLGATLPKTNCGAVYELDEVMQEAHALLARHAAPAKGDRDA